MIIKTILLNVKEHLIDIKGIENTILIEGNNGAK
jgi:hypothetical protein